VPVKAVYSSPLSRAFETATIIAKAKGLEPVIEEPFNDISFGLWEGRLVDEVAREYPEEFKRWVEAPHLWKAPEGDSLTAVKERAWSRLEELSREHEKETLVVVSHRVVLMLLLIAALGMDDSKFWNLEQSPCAINVLTKKDGRYLLSKFNESCHPGSLLRSDLLRGSLAFTRSLFSVLAGGGPESSAPARSRRRSGC